MARSLGWLWRLGYCAESPPRWAAGFGTGDEAAELAAAVREGRLRAAVVLAAAEGEHPPLPPVALRAGTARFGGGLSARGRFPVFAGGRAALRSRLGVHAVREGRLLAVGAAPDAWGRLDFAWALPLIARFLGEVLDRPPAFVPPLGCLRVDDLPGTAELQLRGGAKNDADQRRRVRALVKALERARARLVVAVAAQALADGRPVPLDDIWPRAVEELGRGVERGALEAACHGLLHLDSAAHAEGRIEPREFARLGREEAGRRLDDATKWLRAKVGDPQSFIAPAWGYSEGALAAASERGLLTWLPPAPAPMLEHGRLRETLWTGLPGLAGLGYGALRHLASVGVPPTVVFHGRLLDDRIPSLRSERDAVSLARLLLRRDLERIMRLRGVRWVGAQELAAALEAHAAGGDA